jgi:hypothetical protein
VVADPTYQRIEKRFADARCKLGASATWEQIFNDPACRKWINRAKRIERAYGADDRLPWEHADTPGHFVEWLNRRAVVQWEMFHSPKALRQAFAKAVDLAGSAGLPLPPKPSDGELRPEDGRLYLLALERWVRHNPQAAQQLIHWAQAYASHLQDTGDLSYGLAKRVNEAAGKAGLKIPFPEPRQGAGENANSIYALYDDSVSGESACFRIVDQFGKPVPLSNENRQKILAVLRNLIAEAQAIEPPKPATAQAGEAEAGEPKRKRGRMVKDESEAKRAQMLATIRQHPTLIDDPVKLAGDVGVSESTARRWLEEEREKYRQSKAANPERDEEE